MATKQQVLDDLARGEGCLGKAAADEPVFVLRAQDRSAPAALRNWAEINMLHGSPKAADAARIADQMETWQAHHHDRVKWPD